MVTSDEEEMEEEEEMVSESNVDVTVDEEVEGLVCCI